MNSRKKKRYRKHRTAHNIYVAFEWTTFIALNGAMSYGLYWLVSSGKLGELLKTLQ